MAWYHLPSRGLSMGSVFFYDYSQVRFSPSVGPVLPRRQRLEFRGITATDNGTDIILQTTSEYNTYTPETYGAVGDGVTDDTTAVQAMFTAIRAAGGGRALLSANYLVGDVQFYGKTLLDGGSGRKGGFTQKSGSTYCLSVNPGSGGTTSTSGNEQNIIVRGVSFTGRVTQDGFSEHKHLLNLNAVTGVLVEDCYFYGWQGDAIYIGSSNVAATERHNLNVTVRKCRFDGANADNRNGVTIIDCDGFVIHDNEMVNCTRAGQPGSICLEPDANTFHVLRNGLISNNRITGGNEGGITLNLRPQSALTSPHSNITIEYNYVYGKTSGFNFSGETSGSGATSSTPSYDVIFRGNTIESCATRGYLVEGAAGLKMHDNYYKSCGAAEFGYTKATFGCEMVRELFDGCGVSTVNGLIIRTFDTLVMDSCIFRDCGLTTPAAGGRSIQFQGTSTRLKWRNMTFESPTGRTTYAVQHTGTIDQSTCEEINTRYEFVTNTDVKLPGSKLFTAAPASGTWKLGDTVYNSTPSSSAATPYAWLCVSAGSPGTWVPLWHSGSQDNTSYSPAVTCAGAAITLGNGTLTGSYTRCGNIVTATVKLTVGGTSSFPAGELRIGLPITSSSPEFVGRISIADASAGLYYGADAILQGSAVYAIGVLNAGAIVSATNPITLATGDVIRMTVTYSV